MSEICFKKKLQNNCQTCSIFISTVQIRHTSSLIYTTFNQISVVLACDLRQGLHFSLVLLLRFNSVQAIMDSFLQLFVFFVVVIWCSVMGACHFSKSTISSHWQLKNGAAFASGTETSSTKQLSSRPVSFTSLWIL